jgi:hypothetical protein
MRLLPLITILARLAVLTRLANPVTASPAPLLKEAPKPPPDGSDFTSLTTCQDLQILESGLDGTWAMRAKCFTPGQLFPFQTDLIIQEFIGNKDGKMVVCLNHDSVCKLNDDMANLTF